jgi:hypothetical protein
MVAPAGLPASLRRRVILLAAVLGWRDFAAIATASLLSVYLQRAGGYSVQHAGFVIGAMMLLSIVINPISVYLSPDTRRLPALTMVLISSALVILIVPFIPMRWVLAVMSVFQSLGLASYAISDAATLERVDTRVRGRFVGLFLTLAGTMSALAPWVMGLWTDLLREGAARPLAYLPIFATLSAMMLIAAFAPPIIAKLGPVQGPAIEPVTETDPTPAEVLV